MVSEATYTLVKSSFLAEMRGGASINQHYTYNSPELAPPRPFSLLGGKRTRRARTYKKKRGGFYPSLMGGVLSNGPLLVPAVIGQGMRLLRNNRKRMATRKRKGKKRATK